MDDNRAWALETSLWTGDDALQRRAIDKDCLMVVPAPPFIMDGPAAIAAMAESPRWAKLDLSERRVSRPEYGLVILAYHAKAERDGEAPYAVYCTTTYRRIAPGDWRVIQHQQTPATAGG